MSTDRLTDRPTSFREHIEQIAQELSNKALVWGEGPDADEELSECFGEASIALWEAGEILRRKAKEEKTS